MATRLVPRPVRSLGRQLGRHSTCRCVASLSLRHTKPPTRRNVNSVTPVCLDRGRSGGVGGDDGELNTNVLYERMKALREQELEAENDPVVDALEEKDQAIVAEIRGDAAERVMPEPGDFDGLIEHILSTPLEAMDYESTRCARLMTKAFAAHCDLKMKNASSLGVKGEETLAEMQLLAGWVAEARERGEERDDAARRMRRIDGGQNLVDGKETTSVSVSFPTPMRTAGDKFKVLMHAAQNGVDTLRAEIVQMARSDEIDDALLLILTGNAANAQAEGDDGRAKFLRKIAEVCEREWKNASG